MRTLVSSLLAAVLVAAAATPTLAQSEGPTRHQLEQFQVRASDAPAFEAAVKKIVRAAGEADLAARYGWTTFQDGPRYTVVAPVWSMAQFDDPEEWTRQFEGTPGHATLTAAFADVSKLQTSMRNSVVVAVPELHHASTTEPAGEARFARVFVAAVRPGMEEAFSANMKEWFAAMKEIDYPYHVHGHQTLIGNGGEVHVVFEHDDRSKFLGENDLQALFEKKGKGSEYGRLVEGLLATLDDYRFEDLTYRADLSYVPEAESTSP